VDWPRRTLPALAGPKARGKGHGTGPAQGGPFRAELAVPSRGPGRERPNAIPAAGRVHRDIQSVQRAAAEEGGRGSIDVGIHGGRGEIGPCLTQAGGGWVSGPPGSCPPSRGTRLYESGPAEATRRSPWGGLARRQAATARIGPFGTALGRLLYRVVPTAAPEPVGPVTPTVFTVPDRARDMQGTRGSATNAGGLLELECEGAMVAARGGKWLPDFSLNPDPRSPQGGTPSIRGIPHGTRHPCWEGGKGQNT